MRIIISAEAQTQEEVSISEYTSGKTIKYLSKGEGKSAGLKINFAFPESWSSKEGERPHIVRKFQQPNGYVLGLIFINKTEIEFTQSDIAEVFTAEGLKSIIPASGTYISSNNNLKIENLKAASIEYTDVNQRLDLIIYTHNLSYIFIYKQYLVMIQFFVSGNSDETKEQIDKRYNRIKAIFPLMFNSIVIENIWE